MADLPAGSPRVSKQRSGCLTVLYVVLALGVFSLVCIALGTWLFMRSETGQKVIDTAKQSINLAKDAATAPGTAALRQRGCAQAMVMPIGQLIQLFEKLSPGLSDEIRKEGMPGNGTMVLCQLEAGTAPGLGCADVARAYSEAAPEAPDRFGVMVQHLNARKPVCQGTYTREGELVEPIERK